LVELLNALLLVPLVALWVALLELPHIGLVAVFAPTLVSTATDFVKAMEWQILSAFRAFLSAGHPVRLPQVRGCSSICERGDS
jgi:hypothetical protein